MLFGVSAVAAEMVVVVPIDSPVKALSRDEVGRIFLKKLKVLPGNFELHPVGQMSSPGKDEAFYRDVTGKSRGQLQSYWARLMFTGKDLPPLDGKEDAGVKALLASDLHSVGFIDEASVDESVRVVYRLSP